MKLLAYLDSKNMTQAEFAVRIGVTQVSVSRYCGGQRPNDKVMQKIIEVTGGEVTANDWYDLPAFPLTQSPAVSTNSS